MIQVSQLCRHYGDFKAVDDVSFEIQPGEVVGLLGHNGAGKTTIMKMITGFLEPTSGSICVDELEVGKHTQAIQKRIGYLPENCPVWPEMTVIDYLEYQASLHGVSKANQSAAVAKAIRRTALQHKATDSIQTLSRGLRQRVGVAQAILHDPDIIILDEPTNGLDPTQIHQMRELIAELSQSATVIISTHILQEVQAVCERVLIMRSGKLAVDSRLDALQTGHHLLLAVDNDKASDYLKKVTGVAGVKRADSDPAKGAGSAQATGAAKESTKESAKESANAPVNYILEADANTAPEVAAAVHAAGDKLYYLQAEKRNLDSVFAEVNAQAQG